MSRHENDFPIAVHPLGSDAGNKGEYCNGCVDFGREPRGSIASNAGGLLSLKFSRGAEAEADADAVAMLSHAEIDPRPTAAAFDGFGKQEGDLPEWLGDHPSSKGRAIAFRHSYQPARAYRPTLSAAQTKALMSACRAPQ
jgi:predicted Zn-dependent protease